MKATVALRRGFALLEALVAVLIFSFGILGVIGLQASMTKAQTQSKMRADAAFLAQQVVASMWADATNKSSYLTANCATYGPCNDWKARVATVLPNANTAISVPNVAFPDEYEVSISWVAPNEEPHTYKTVTAVAVNAP